MDPTLSCGLLYLSFGLLYNWHRWTCKLSSPPKKITKYPAPPGPACHSFLSPGLSSTVVIPAFVHTHRPGSSTLFGLAVSFSM